MEECKTVPSQQGRNKIIVKGYLMVKDKQRNDLYYWNCEKKRLFNCKGRASTILINERHMLRADKEHNHGPEPSRVGVASVNSMIKDMAKSTTNKPLQIIQSTQSEISEDIRPYLPSYEAQRKKVKRMRVTCQTIEPSSIDDINIPDFLKNTLSNQPFLIKESSIGDDKILVFCTVLNIQKLSQSRFWIVDGTFKTVPTIFTQLYTIHAQVGFGENFRICPLVYVLMTSKREQCYKQLYQDVIDFAEDNGVHLSPEYIISDFELAAINASKCELPMSKSKGCLFHLCQSAWRKLQGLGLSMEYGVNENFNIKVRQMLSLAFLPEEEIPDAFEEIKKIMPDNAIEFVKWFEDNYALGKIRRIVRNTEHRNDPLFPPSLWSIYENIDKGLPRTSNHAEAWHRRWNELVGRAHIGLFALIKELQKEQVKVEADIEAINRGASKPRPTRLQQQREQRLQMAFKNREGKTLIEYLRGIAHNLSL